MSRDRIAPADPEDLQQLLTVVRKAYYAADRWGWNALEKLGRVAELLLELERRRPGMLSKLKSRPPRVRPRRTTRKAAR